MPKRVQKRYSEPALGLKWGVLEEEGEKIRRKGIVVVVQHGLCLDSENRLTSSMNRHI